MRRVLRLLIFFALVLGAATPALADLPPGGSFLDDDGNVHEGAIEGLAAGDITRGCDPREIYFCPDRPVTRGEMAAFLARALGLEAVSDNRFVDDGFSEFEDSINAVAAADITLGCNPPLNDQYCPGRSVTRQEMASLLARALDLAPAAQPWDFGDLEGSVHSSDISALAESGITVGCNPPANDEFCPYEAVTRAQMASFLIRALPGLEFNEPPDRLPSQRVSRFTTYHACCEARVHNIQLMADAIDGYVVMPGEVFSINDHVGPRTSAKGYLPAPVLCGGNYCQGTGGGISQFASTMFNAIFYGGYEEVAHRPHSVWISRYPVGIEATLGYPSLDVAFRNDTQTPVTIRAPYTATSITIELWGNVGGWQMTGYHPLGATESVIDVIERGWQSSRRVSWEVDGSPPGSVAVRRTISQHGESTSETWYHTYR